MIDSTPPIPGKITVNFVNDAAQPNRKDKYDTEVVIHWKDFMDLESGIVGYEFGVGSLPGSQDVSNFKPVSGLTALYNGQGNMQDGEQYYFQVKV